jgi:uncharacterized OB-fold protein
MSGPVGDAAKLVPVPDVADPAFAPFFDGCAVGKLVIPQCSNCGAYCWPPRFLCPSCGSRKLQWTEVRAEGEVFSYTVVHRAAQDWLISRVPYAVAIVALDECGVRMLGSVDNLPELGVGVRVHAVFRSVDGMPAMPHWTLGTAP